MVTQRGTIPLAELRSLAGVSDRSDLSKRLTASRAEIAKAVTPATKVTHTGRTTTRDSLLESMGLGDYGRTEGFDPYAGRYGSAGIDPSISTREYTRDLGAGAVDLLLSGRGGALVTRQEGEIVPLPFDDLIDPETGRTRVRMVDTATDFYRHALSLQTRIHARDRDDPERLSPLAQAAGLSPEEAQSYFGPSS